MDEFEDFDNEEKIEPFSDGSGRRWTKITRARKSGKSAQERDVYITTPCGKRLRSFKNLTLYLQRKGWYDINPKKINFQKSQIGTQKECHQTKEFIKFIESKGQHIPR